jgi:4-hydroxybenzoate polyprenyltransferase
MAPANRGVTIARLVAIDTLESPRARPLAARPPAPFWQALRPAQWTKNLLVFAGIVFAAELGDLDRWWRAIAVFVAYCAASSAAYLVNDVRDAREDGLHPVKRLRPIASGALGIRPALAASAVLAVLGLGLAATTGGVSAGILAGFLALQLAYTLRLKHAVLVDVLAIAGLFVLRAAAGAVAVDVRLSPWLVLCTGLLALFLALAKRRGELLLVHADETPGRPVLEGYALDFVDQLLSITAAATIGAYSIYTFTATSSDTMMLTIPFVVFGVFRYLYLVHRKDLGEEPERVFVTDLPLLATVVLWAATAALILGLD